MTNALIEKRTQANTSAGHLHRLGLEKRRSNQVQDAVKLLCEAVRHAPWDPEIVKNLGNCYKDWGKVDQAERCFCKAISLNENYPEAYYDLGSLYFQTQQLDKSIAAFRKAITLRPNYAQAFNNLALALDASGNTDEALVNLRKSIACNANQAEAWNNLGNIYKRSNQLAQAQHHYQKALALQPTMVAALNNLGQIHLHSGKIEAAITCFTKAMSIDPRFLDSYVNLGNVYQLNKLWRKARTVYLSANQLQPNHPVVLFNLAMVAKEMGDPAQSVTYCKQALFVKPDFEKACAYLVNLLLHQCDWEQLSSVGPLLDRLTAKSLANGQKPVETPFMSLIRHDQLDLNLSVARAYSLSSIPIVPETVFNHNPAYTQRSETIRIGYLSNNFRNHASADLICGILEQHDHRKFQIVCYHYGPNDGSAQRRRIEAACDRFVDLSHNDDLAAAQAIRQDTIHILVDLVGHTEMSRLGICGWRPAPLQVRYLGFAGSSGAPFFDYLIADKQVTPVEHAPWFSEKLILMPDSYHVNHYRSLYAHNDQSAPRSRQSGQEPFVFCCFNQTYKIDPMIFRCWAAILKGVPKSQLWLLTDDEGVQINLRKQMACQGVAPDRLVFFHKDEKKRHLERLAAAQVALDTLAVSGAATTADALWAGVPVVAMRGNHFASRMSASILAAAGLEELICADGNAYIQKAITLGRNPECLQAIKTKLMAFVIQAPIFDPVRFTRHLETAYTTVWNRFLRGLEPALIDLSSEAKLPAIDRNNSHVF